MWLVTTILNSRTLMDGLKTQTFTKKSVQFKYIYIYIYGERDTNNQVSWCGPAVGSSSAGCSVVSDSLWSHGLQPAKLLCPWNAPGKNTVVDWTRVPCIAGKFFTIWAIREVQQVLLWKALWRDIMSLVPFSINASPLFFRLTPISQVHMPHSWSHLISSDPRTSTAPLG